MSVSLLETLNLTLGTGDRAFSANPGSAPKGCLVYIIHNANSDFIAGVDYGGVALTEVTGSPLGKGGGEAGIVHAFFAGSGLPSGAQSVTVDTTAGSTYCAICYVLGGAADLELVDIETLSSNSLANPSATLSLSGRECFAAVGGFSGQDTFGGVTPRSGWANSMEQDFGSQMGVSYAYNTIGTADVTAGWTQTAEDVLAIAVAVGEISGAYTLACVTGSFTLTGNAAGLLASRQLPGATQSYALTGNAASLTVGRKVAANVATFSLTGTPAGLTAQRRMVAAQGALSLTGVATGLRAGRLLTATTRAYALTGVAVNLTAARRLSCAVGALTLTGVAAGLIYAPTGGYTMAAATGSFALTGVPVNLRATRLLPAALYAVTLTRNPAGLFAGRLLTAAVRALALTGQPAGLRAARRLVADTRALVLYAPSVGLVYSGAPAPVVAAVGKYKPEHDSALVDLAAATGFAAEHASALRDLQSAG